MIVYNHLLIKKLFIFRLLCEKNYLLQHLMPYVSFKQTEIWTDHKMWYEIWEELKNKFAEGQFLDIILQ